MTLDRDELMDLLVERSGLNREEVRSQLEVLTDRIRSIATGDGSLEIEDFGTFSLGDSGELSFTPSDLLKVEVNYRYVGMEPVEVAPARGSRVVDEGVSGAVVRDDRSGSDASASDEQTLKIPPAVGQASDTEPDEPTSKEPTSKVESDSETKSAEQHVSGSETGAEADSAGSEVDAPEPGVAESEAAGSGATERDAAGSESAGLEVAGSETGGSESAESEAGRSQAAESEAGSETARQAARKRSAGPAKKGRRSGNRTALQLTAVLMALIVIGAGVYAMFGRTDSDGRDDSDSGGRAYVSPATGGDADEQDRASAGSAGRSPTAAGAGTERGGGTAEQSSGAATQSGGTSAGQQQDVGPAGSGNSDAAIDDASTDASNHASSDAAVGELQDSARIEGGGPERSSPFGLHGSAVPQQSRHYSIILHSVRREAHARELQSALQDEGYRTVRYSVEHEEMGTMWRVGIGQFASIDDALEVAEDLPARWRENHFIGSIPKH